MKAHEEFFVTIYQGDCLLELQNLPAESVHCCVTSPPYWGLRDYGVFGQIGLEKTPEEYVAKMVEVFREVKRVLRDDGTLWLNLGDTYAASRSYQVPDNKHSSCDEHQKGSRAVPDGLKPKNLCGIPWRVAFALQADGWYLRQDIIWHKPNPMPESVTDRCTKSHEYIFLLSKSERYYYNSDAIKEPVTGNSHARGNGVNPKSIKIPNGWDTDKGSHGAFHRQGRGTGDRYKIKQNESFSSAVKDLVDFRNKRSVWSVPTFPFPNAHFATFPPDLIKPCILAGCSEGGTVLDPFLGSGTTAYVAKELGRRCIGIELNEKYIPLAKERIIQEVLNFNGERKNL